MGKLTELVQTKVEGFSLDFNERLRKHNKNVEEAFEAAERAENNSQSAFLRMHQQLENTIDQGSRALRKKIEASTAAIVNSMVATETNADNSMDATKTNVDNLPDYQGGFYGLIAKEVLDQELKTMIQTAVSQLQKVSDDVAGRIALFSDMAATERSNDWVAQMRTR